MRKLFAIAFLIIGFTVNSNAQISNHAIGLRGGLGRVGFGGEFSYQYGLNDINRLEFDLGSNGSRYSNFRITHQTLSVIYHWVWPIKDGLNWYVGPGGQIGSYRDSFYGFERNITIGVGGQIGIEYDFNQHDVPLLLGLDTRPMLGLGNYARGYGFETAFSLRYTF